MRGIRTSGSTNFLTRTYDATYGGVASSHYRGVTVEHLDRDAMGRPQTVRVSIPRALQAPLPMYPFEWFARGGIPGPGQAGYDPNFQWYAITGAGAATVTAYDFELRQPPRDLSPAECDAGMVLYRTSVSASSLQIPFASLPVTLAAQTPYCFRVRGKTGSGEIGPFSPWVMFKIGGPGRYRIDTRPISNPKVRAILVNCAVIRQQAFSNTFVDCPNDENPPVPPESATPPPPDIVAPTTPNVVFEILLRYDSLGRLSELKHPDPDASWSANNRRGSWQRFTYDAQRGHNTIAYQRASDAAPITLFSGTTYEATRMKGRTAPLLDYDLQPAGHTLQEDRTYDALGRQRSLRLHEGETNHYYASDMTYNDWGYLQSQSRNDQALSGAMSYGYDDRGRMTSFTIGGQSATYSYDNAGNLTSVTRIGVTGLSLYPGGPATARLDLVPFSGASYDSRNRRNGWQHDNGGRVTTDDHYTYAYNEIDQLVEVREGTWVVAQYLYDADGRRVREVSETHTVYFVRSPGCELVSQETHYPWGKDQRLPEQRDFIYHNGAAMVEMVWTEDVTAYPAYYFRDRLGNPVVSLGGGDGFIPRYAEYDPYGRQMRTQRFAKDLAHEFTGHERDEVSGLDYMMLRYYEPQYGRFTRPDPMLDRNPSDPTSFNMYAYVRGNPANLTDPTGGQGEVMYGTTTANTAATLSGPATLEDKIDAVDMAYAGLFVAVTGTCMIPVVGEYVCAGLAFGAIGNDENEADLSGVLAWGLTKGEGIFRTPRGPAATQALAEEIANMERFPHKRAVLVLETKQGPTLVAAGEKDLSPAQIAKAKELGLIPVKAPGFHAEKTGIIGASERGLTPTRGATSLPICDVGAEHCKEFIESMGGKMTDTHTFEFP